VQTPATPDLSLVMRLGQRFESARRLFIFALDKPNMRHRRSPGDGLGVSLHPPIHHRGGATKVACYEWLQAAGGLGKSSNITRLADVPRFRRVRHRRGSVTLSLRRRFSRKLASLQLSSQPRKIAFSPSWRTIQREDRDLTQTA
jgi:hypothetical protein